MPRRPDTEPNLRLTAARQALGITSSAKCARALERHAHTRMQGRLRPAATSTASASLAPAFRTAS